MIDEDIINKINEKLKINLNKKNILLVKYNKDLIFQKLIYSNNVFFIFNFINKSVPVINKFILKLIDKGSLDKNIFIAYYTNKNNLELFKFDNIIIN